MLTEQQKASYADDGYVILGDVLTPEEIQRLREVTERGEFDRRRKDKGGDEMIVHDLGFASVAEDFWKLGEHPRVLDAVQDVLGPDIQVHHSKLATKPPSDAPGGVFDWHQDFAFFPHTYPGLCAAFIYLDDTTVDNGCMRFIKGSHKLGQLPHEDENGYFVARCTAPVDESRAVDIEVSAGGISIHHVLTLHSSDVNRSGRPRRGMIFQYRASDAALIGGVRADETGRQVRGTFSGVIRCEGGPYRIPRWPAAPLPGHGTWGAYDLLVGPQAKMHDS